VIRRGVNSVPELTAILFNCYARPPQQSPEMTALTAFGLFAVTAMLVCYALEKRSPWFILGFAASCALGSIYGFLQGAWPFGVVEAVWAVVATNRWRRSRGQR
jgi:hypothetical protein